MKKNLLKFITILLLAVFVPFIASAQATGLTDVITKISDLFKAILPVLVAFGVLYFIWGMVQYFIADGEEAKKNGRDRIIYGIIGLAVIVSIWGLVAILNQTFGLGGTTGLGVGQTPDLGNLVTTTKNSGSGCPDLGAGKPKLSDYLDFFTCIIGNSIIPFIFALAVVMFIWGVVKFLILDADEEAKRAQGKQFMIWGIIALAVMLSVWGLVNILQTTFAIKTGSSVLPTVVPPQK
ncbi:hypothetical protein HY311_03395 [Candidatus Nomurabacteria bacterium]|nr:hypothetical protein [Candidatus Nomurabacteria bacterium]